MARCRARLDTCPGDLQAQAALCRALRHLGQAPNREQAAARRSADAALRQAPRPLCDLAQVCGSPLLGDLSQLLPSGMNTPLAPDPALGPAEGLTDRLSAVFSQGGP